MPRLDKNGLPVPGRERVCLDLKPVNKCLEHYDHPIPRMDMILQELMKYKFFLEGDLARLGLPSIPSFKATSRQIFSLSVVQEEKFPWVYYLLVFIGQVQFFNTQ